MKPTLINLTPHDMHVYAPDTPAVIHQSGYQPIRVYPASGDIARAAEIELGSWRLGPETIADVEHHHTVGLPPYAGDMDSRDREVWYLVSLVTALGARGRGDLLVPHLAVRDLSGRVIGCRAFARPV